MDMFRSVIVVARRLPGLLLVTMLSWPALTLAQVSPQLCGALKPNPWDYRKDKHMHALVEDAHFTPPVEMLVRGNSTSLPAPDIEYTLSVFPNHPRALVAATRLSERDQTQLRNQLPRPIECYYERALRFRADDVVVRMLYVQFLAKRNRQPEALNHLADVVRRAEDSPLTLRNAGLLYMELKEYDKALALAHRIEVLAPWDPVLRDALQKADKWRAPVQAAQTEASAAAASAPK